jgi:hypothetical protein
LGHRESIARFQDSELFTGIAYQADLTGTNLVVDSKIIFRGNGYVPPLSENKKADPFEEGVRLTRESAITESAQNAPKGITEDHSRSLKRRLRVRGGTPT